MSNDAEIQAEALDEFVATLREFSAVVEDLAQRVHRLSAEAETLIDQAEGEPGC